MSILNFYLNSTVQLNFLCRRILPLKKTPISFHDLIGKCIRYLVGSILHIQGQAWKSSYVSWANGFPEYWWTEQAKVYFETLFQLAFTQRFRRQWEKAQFGTDLEAGSPSRLKMLNISHMSGWGQMLNHRPPPWGVWQDKAGMLALWSPRAFINCNALPRVTSLVQNQHLRMGTGADCRDHGCHLCHGTKLGVSKGLLGPVPADSGKLN